MKAPGLRRVSVSGGRLRVGEPAGVSNNLWRNGVLAPAGGAVGGGRASRGAGRDIQSSPVARLPDAACGGGGASGWPGARRRLSRWGLRCEYSRRRSWMAGRRRESTKLVSTAPEWLRLGRVGDAWMLSYPGDGASLTSAGSFSFAMTAYSMGPWAGNRGSAGWNPAFEAVFNCFPLDVAVPGWRSDETPPLISDLEVVASARTATVS